MCKQCEVSVIFLFFNKGKAFDSLSGHLLWVLSSVLCAAKPAKYLRLRLRCGTLLLGESSLLVWQPIVKCKSLCKRIIEVEYLFQIKINIFVSISKPFQIYPYESAYSTIIQILAWVIIFISCNWKSTFFRLWSC